MSFAFLAGPREKVYLTDITGYSASGLLADRVRIPPSPPIQNPSRNAGVFYWLIGRVERTLAGSTEACKAG